MHMQGGELEQRLEAQLGELKIIMNALVELETRHVKAVTQYQEEIRLLRAELENRGGVPPEIIAAASSEPAAKRPRLSQGAGRTPHFPPLVGLKAARPFANRDGASALSTELTGSKPLKPAGSSTSWSLSCTGSGNSKVSVDLKHQLTHDSAVCSVRFSNSGSTLATGCKKAAYVYDVKSGERTGVFSIDTECYIRSVCFSPDDKLLATGAEDKNVRVYDVQTQAVQIILAGHTMEIFSVDWTSNGQYIVSGSGDKSIRIWEADTGDCTYTLALAEKADGPTGITCVAVSPDNQVIAAGSLDKSVRFWGIAKGNFLGEFAGKEGHQDSVYAVAFSPDGQFLASGSLDETLRLWDLQSLTVPRCHATFTGHKGWVLSLAFTPDGKWLLSGSKDLTIRFWDYRTPGATEPSAILNRPKEWNSVIGISVSPKGNFFATGSGDYKGRIWEYVDPEKRPAIQ